MPVGAFGQEGPSVFQGGQGFAPVVQGWQFRPTTGFESLGVSNPLAAMILQPLLGQMMIQNGFMPIGFHSQNVYDHMQNLRMTQMHQELLQQAAKSDQASFQSTFRGVARMFGTPWTPETATAAATLASGLTSVTPFLTQVAPDLVDAMAGPMGSAAVMQQGLFMGGRYRMDPFTGRMGLSADSQRAMIPALRDALFPDGTVTATSGLSMGQVGLMFDELQRRGMVGGSLNFGGRERMSGQELEELQASNPELATAVRANDIKRIEQTIRNYSSAVSAMRDIFGDMGRPNAPMAELIRGLEELTQGSLSQIDPGRLSQIVRTTRNLAQMTGVPMEAAMMMQQHAAAISASMGLNPMMAMQITQGGLAFGSALENSGFLARPAWGLMNAEQQRQLDINLRAGAAGSQVANRVGAVLRLGEAIGGFTAGSDAANLVAALQSGQAEFVRGGKTVNIADLKDADITSMLVAGGASSPALVQQFLGQEFANQEFIERNDLSRVIRERAQVVDAKKFTRATLASSFNDTLLNEKLPSDKAAQIANQAAAYAAEALFSADPDKISDRKFRGEVTANALQRAMREAGAGDLAGGAFTGGAAEAALGRADQLIRAQMPHFQGLVNMLGQFNPKVMDAARRTHARAQAQARLQTALSPLGRGGVLSEVVGALQDIGKGDGPATIPDLLARTLGVEKEDVDRQLSESVETLHKEMQTLADLEDKLVNADPGQRAALSQQVEAQRAKVQGLAQTLAETGQKQGLLVGSNVTRGQIKTAREDIDALRSGKLGKNAAERLQRAAGVLDAALMDDALMGKMGRSGMDRVTESLRGRDKLERLAQQYTGGDIGKLLRGEFEAEEKETLMASVSSILGTIEVGVGEVESGFRSRTAGDTSEDFKKALAEAREQRGRDAKSVVSSLVKSFGLEGQIGEEEQAKLASGLARRGLGAARELLISREQLSKAAEKLGLGKGPEGVEKVLAQIDEKGVNKVIEELGYKGREAFQFRQSLATHAREGELHKPGDDANDLREVLGEMARSEMRPGLDEVAGGDGEGRAIVITGKLEIDGNIGSLEGHGAYDAGGVA